MKKIDAILEKGVYRPADSFPEDAVQVIFNGTHYLCYSADEVVPIEYGAEEPPQEGKE